MFTYYYQGRVTLDRVYGMISRREFEVFVVLPYQIFCDNVASEIRNTRRVYPILSLQDLKGKWGLRLQLHLLTKSWIVVDCPHTHSIEYISK